MIKRGRAKKLGAVLVLSMLALGMFGCGKKDEDKSQATKDVTKVEKTAQGNLFPFVVENEGEEIKDGVLNIGVISGEPFNGFFNPVFYISSLDFAFMQPTMAGTFETNELGQTKEGDEDARIKFEFDKENKTFTLTAHKDLKWSNGEDFTSDDIIATYMMMGDPNFIDNARYDEDYEIIEGMKEYHEGKAPTISGIERVDDKKVVFHLNKATPSLLYGAGLIYEYLNRNQVAEAAKDYSKFAEAELNTKPLSYGPYYLEKTVNGESALFKKNPYFYKADKVRIPTVLIRIIPPAQASEFIKKGEIDLVEIGSEELYEKIKDYDSGKVVGYPESYLSYIGFKLGKYKEGVGVITDPNAKAADVRVRQAFAYAVDWDKINEVLFKNLRSTPKGSGYFPPSRGDLHNPNAPKFTLDQQKAKQLLAEAGLKDIDGDGLVEDKNGNKLVFNFLFRNIGQSIDEPLAQNFINSWRAVGLDVQLVNGKLSSPQESSKLVREDSDTVDLYQFAWGLGSDPNPSGFFSAKSKLNWPRYTTERLENALKSLSNEDVFDRDILIQRYKEVDEVIREELPTIPFTWRYNLYWVGNRLSKMDVTPLKEFHLYEQTLVEPKK